MSSGTGLYTLEEMQKFDEEKRKREKDPTYSKPKTSSWYLPMGDPARIQKEVAKRLNDPTYSVPKISEHSLLQGRSGAGQASYTSLSSGPQGHRRMRNRTSKK